MSPQPISIVGTDAANSFEDLSGLISKAVKASTLETPYDLLIDVCSNDQFLIQKAYETHRTTRNAQQRVKLLSPEFSGMIVDKVLQELEYVGSDRSIPELAGVEKRVPAEIDPRNCLVFWARPTNAVKELVGTVQEKLRELAPNIWLMPRDSLHLTVLEIAHSKTPEIIDALVTQMQSWCQKIVSLPQSRRTTLIKPMLSYDAAALAISFVPATRDPYTYHHLRKDLYKLAMESEVSIASRYTVPSAHITVARFVTARDHQPAGSLTKWVERIEEINHWLAEEWSRDFKWTVGEERGIEFRAGRLWYGGGYRVANGKGFNEV